MSAAEVDWVIELTPTPSPEESDSADREIARAVARVRPIIDLFDELGVDWFAFATSYARAQHPEVDA